jgi:hypothetical protein
MAEDVADGVLSIEEVLAAEADEFAGEGSAIADRLSALLRGEQAQKKRFELNADDREGKDVDEATIEARRQLYHSLNELKRTALCFSGGGIRSATFCLGVVQALARYDVNRPPLPPRGGIAAADATSAGRASQAAVPATLDTTLEENVLQKRPEETNAKFASSPETTLPPLQKRRPEATEKAKVDPKNSLLGRFHYLSTVSGGGYIGSWLSAWRTRNDFETVIRKLTDRPGGPDFEPPEISWLRAYSNYLTPRLGIGSADTWAAVAIVARNILLNWLLIIPVICFVLLVLKFIATGSAWIAHNEDHTWIMSSIGWTGAVLLIIAQRFTTRHRPARQPSSSDSGKCFWCHRTGAAQSCFLCRHTNVSDKGFVFGDLAWAIGSAILFTVFLSSRYFQLRLEGWMQSITEGTQSIAAQLHFAAAVQFLNPDFKMKFLILAAVVGLLIYLVGWIAPLRLRKGAYDFIYWTVSGLVYGALVGLGAYLYHSHAPYPHDPDSIWCFLAPAIFGVPWLLMSQLAAENIFVGLSSYGPNSDSDREWLGRSAGWLAAAAIAWAIVAFLVFAGGYAVQLAIAASPRIVVALGGVTGIISGIATALFGSSSKTPAKPSSEDSTSYTALAYNIGLAISGPIFVAVLTIALSVALDKVLVGDYLVAILQANTFRPGPTLCWLLGGGVISAGIGVLASWFVNINRFSLHALYRNRLVRAYLGASRQERHPDHFTGFDPADNVRMHELWWPGIQPRRLFHVVNIALNVVSTKRLAWQERKAESFTVTPQHCGSAYVGFRPSKVYGDGPKNEEAAQDPNRLFGIALGTAMAISGAAVSPNMGYHSSPSVTLLLALFNVRLGWWLGNPGPAGDHHQAYRHEGPRFSAKPLFYEALGLTTDKSTYVYLSDGGHFENLGFYEMVRRRCRLIVVVDAGCDPDFTFEDLGNAVRKIYIDLGIRITFDTLQGLQNRPSKKELRRDPDGEDEARKKIPYHALGIIHYFDADGAGCENGTIIYVKPAYHGTEGAAIRSYATANKTFPHETTADQWFTESQFESYRALGLDIGKNVFDRPEVRGALLEYLTP